MPRTLVATVCLLAVLAGSAAAEPDPPPAGDVVLHLLQERGLWPAAGGLQANPVVQQMRDAAS